MPDNNILIPEATSLLSELVVGEESEPFLQQSPESRWQLHSRQPGRTLVPRLACHIPAPRACARAWPQWTQGYCPWHNGPSDCRGLSWQTLPFFAGCGIPPTASASHQSHVLDTPLSSRSCPPHTVPASQRQGHKSGESSPNTGCVTLHRRLRVPGPSVQPPRPAQQKPAFKKIQSHGSATLVTASAVPTVRFKETDHPDN